MRIMHLEGAKQPKPRFGAAAGLHSRASPLAQTPAQDTSSPPACARTATMAIRNTLLVSVAKRVVLLALLTQCSGFSTLSHHRVGVANGADVGRARVASVPTGPVRMAATSGAAAVPRAVATCRRALDLRARMTRSRMPSVTSGTARVLTIRGGAESEVGTRLFVSVPVWAKVVARRASHVTPRPHPLLRAE